MFDLTIERPDYNALPDVRRLIANTFLPLPNAPQQAE
jgi:hypothetical protein